MHFTILAIAGAYAMLANAQVTQNTATPTESSASFQSAQATCLDNCDIADLGCRTKCINLHNPSGDTILAVQKCQASCVQGDSSVEQTSIYAMCLQGCINTNGAAPTVGNAVSIAVASTASGAAPTSTASSSVVSATTIGTSTGSKTSTAGSSSSATAPGAATSAAPTGNTADAVRVGMGGVALFGLSVAFVM